MYFTAGKSEGEGGASGQSAEGNTHAYWRGKLPISWLPWQLLSQKHYRRLEDNDCATFVAS